MQAASTVAKVHESRDVRLSGSFRRAPSTRTPDAPAPAATGAVSVSYRRGVPPTASPLSQEGPHTVGGEAAGLVGGNPRDAVVVALPGSIISSASGDARGAAANPVSARTAGEDGAPPSARSGKAARESGTSNSTSNSRGLRGVVVLGEGGEPVFIDEDTGAGAAGGGAGSASETGPRSSRGARHSNAEMMELEVVKSKDGDAAALFRAVTPAETARRKHNGWWEGEEGQRSTLSESGSIECERV